MRFSAVILAGGKSTRMGRDKAFLEVGGQTLLSRQIATAHAVGTAEIFISGRADTDYSAFVPRVLHDEFFEAGPLAGIHVALAAAQNPLLLVLAVDLPNLKPDMLRKILARAGVGRGAIPRVNGNIKPLAAFYPKAVWQLCANSLDGKFNSARDFAAWCDPGWRLLLICRRTTVFSLRTAIRPATPGLRLPPHEKENEFFPQRPLCARAFASRAEKKSPLGRARRICST